MIRTSRGLVAGALSVPTLFVSNLIEWWTGIGLLLPGLLFGLIVLLPELAGTTRTHPRMRVVLLLLLSVTTYYGAIVGTVSLYDSLRLGAPIVSGGLAAILVVAGTRLILGDQHHWPDLLVAALVGAIGGTILIADLPGPAFVHAGIGFLIWQGGVANLLRPRRPTHHHPSPHD